MNRFKNITLVYKCDEQTLEGAANLSKANGANLTIVYPVKTLPGGAERLSVGGKVIELRQLARNEISAQLKEVADSAKLYGVQPATRLLVGDPSIEIIRDVIENDRDLVIMTADGKGGLKQRLFGSLSSHLIRKCPVPLLIMKPGKNPVFQNILAAVDPEVSGEPRDTLNGTILKLAKTLSAPEGSSLHVTHVWRLPWESLLRDQTGLEPEEVDQLVRAESNRCRNEVLSLLKEHRIEGAQLHLVKGEPGEEIPQLVADLGIDLLVMGTVCRTGIPGLIIGNTAEQVMDRVDCSVLVVKPEGFVSPVAPLLAASQP